MDWFSTGSSEEIQIRACLIYGVAEPLEAH